MALINCPECNATISEFSKVCIRCGFPIAEAGVAPPSPVAEAAPFTPPPLPPDVITPPVWNPETPPQAQISAEVSLNPGDHNVTATQQTPAFIVYLIDVSASMNQPLAPDGSGPSKISIVREAIQRSIKVMMRRSMKGEIISERYGLVMLTYGDRVNDVYRGNTSIAEAVKRPLPEFQMQVRTNTALAFSEASKIIKKNLKFLGNSPSPIICHLTDGEYNDGGSPQQIVQEIRSIRNTDGPVLVENVFVGTDLTREPITDIRHWPGVLSPDSLTTDYLRDLYDMSSPLPASYAGEIRTFGYGLQPGAKMLIPAQSPELVELAFVMGSATKTK